MDMITLAAAKSYTKKTLDGMGSLQGKDGKSAYQIWLDNGNKGTEQDFLNSLKGTKGDKGDKGEDGVFSDELADEITLNTEARHTHENKKLLDEISIGSHGNLEVDGWPYWSNKNGNVIESITVDETTGDITIRERIVPNKAIPLLETKIKQHFKTSELENDSGFITAEDIPEITDIPTKLSDFENDIGFITDSHKDKDYGIYDFQNYVDGYLGTDGELVTSAGFVTSDFISVVPNKEYTISACRYIVYYDFEKNCISQETKGKGVQDVVIPNNAYYVRISWFRPQDWNLAFVGKGKSIPYLPPYIYSVVGKEISVYFDGLGLDDYKLYTFDFNIADGNANNSTGQDERIVFNPTTTGAYLMNLTVYKDGECVGTCKSYLTVRDENAASGVSKTALIIGDSLVAQNHYVTELYNLFDADEANLTLIGTKGTAPYLHEGISGASTDTFLNGNTPFKNPDTGKFDFAYYMSENSYSGVDFVIFNLGINDIFYADTVEEVETTTQAVVDNLTEMIASIQTYNASTVVCVNVTIPPSYSQDAFGNNYGVSPLRWTYRRAYNRLIEKIIDAFKIRDSRHQYLNPVNVNLDTEHNMQIEEVAVNSRNTQTIKRQSNGVHPAECGYYQMADVTYYTLKFLSHKYSV